MGNGVAARHYAIINASRVKRLLDKGIKGLNEGEIEKLGLKKPKPIVPVVDPEDPVIVPQVITVQDDGSAPPGTDPGFVDEEGKIIKPVLRPDPPQQTSVDYDAIADSYGE